MCLLLLLLLHQASTETRRAHGFGGIAVWPIQRSKRIEPASLPASLQLAIIHPSRERTKLSKCLKCAGADWGRAPHDTLTLHSTSDPTTLSREERRRSWLAVWRADGLASSGLHRKRCDDARVQVRVRVRLCTTQHTGAQDTRVHTRGSSTQYT